MLDTDGRALTPPFVSRYFLCLYSCTVLFGYAIILVLAMIEVRYWSQAMDSFQGDDGFMAQSASALTLSITAGVTEYQTLSAGISFSCLAQSVR